MAHCYALTDKVTGQRAKLVEVDERMCAHFGVEPHPTNWFRNWENILGLGFAMGYDYAKIKEILDGDTEQIELLEWINAHYTVDAWREFGR